MSWSTFKNIVLAELAAIGAGIANLFGGWDAPLAILIGMMAADYITGLLVALVFKTSPKTDGGTFSSNVSFKGLIRKLGELAIVFIGVLLDRFLGVNYARTSVILFFAANEGLSILENTALMGVPYPTFIRNTLEILKEKSNAPTENEKKDEDVSDM